MSPNRCRPCPRTEHLGRASTSSDFKSWIAGSSPAMTKEASGMRQPLRIDDLLQPPEHAHAGQQLFEAPIRRALFLDGGDELAVLELDPVHRDVNLGDVDRFVLAVEQIVVAGEVRAVVADVAEE